MQLFPNFIRMSGQEFHVCTLYIYIFISNHINMIWPCSKDSEYVSDLEGIFPAYVVVHGQHGDVEAGQEDTSQDSFFFLI